MNVKKITIIALIVLVVIYLLGSNFLWSKYTNKKFEFSIMLPRLWYKEEGVLGTVIMAKAPLMSQTDNFQENISVIVTYVPAEMNLSTFFELNKNSIMEVIPGEEFDIQEGQIYAGKERGLWISLSSRGKQMTLRTISAMFVKRKQAYIVTCSADELEFDKYKPIFKKVIRSIRFK
jgi:hypothetical protein